MIKSVNKLGLLLLLPALVVGVFTFSTKSASAAYDGAHLIDNSKFLDAGSMSAAAIQQHLASKGSGLANMSFVLNCYGQNSKERQWYSAVGAPCDQSVPASHIIYYAAQIYGINPQVIMATMQKEQSIITSPNPAAWQINQAMGYACPTSGDCDSSSNFFYQIDSGTWALRYHYERANGNNTWWNSGGYTCGNKSNDDAYTYYRPGLIPGNVVTFYDGNGYKRGGVAYRTYQIANAATGALYCYTPHAFNNPQGLYGKPTFGTVGQYYSGSYNFVYWFENWFGTTKGTVLIQGSGSTVYLLSGSTKYGIPNIEMVYNYGLGFTPVTPVSDAFLQSLTDGGTLSVLFNVPGDQTVYLADGAKKYGIPSGDYCTAWGYNCSSGVVQLAYAAASQMQDGGTLQPLMSHNYVVYKMQNGLRRPYLSWQAVLSDGYNTGNITTVLSKTYNTGAGVGTPILESNSLVSFGNNQTVYYYLGGQYYAIPDGNTLKNWFPGKGIYKDTLSSYANSPPSSIGMLWSLFKTNAGKTFVLYNGKRVDVTNSVSNWPTPYTNPSMDSGITNYPLMATDTTATTYRTPDGAIYQLSGGKRLTVASMNDFYQLGYSTNDIINLDEPTLSMIPKGAYAIGEGSVFKVSGSNIILLKGPGQSVQYLTSLSQLSQFRLTREDPVMPTTQLNSYTQPTALSSFIGTNGSANAQFVVDANSHVWNFGTTEANQWGIYSPTITNMSSGGATFSTLPKTNKALPAFADYGGTIYYGAGGVKHPIATWSSYEALGGNASNTFKATKDFIDAAPTGSVM